MWPLRSTVRRRSGVLWAEAIQLEPRPQRKSKSIDALKRCALGTSTAHDLTEGRTTKCAAQWWARASPHAKPLLQWTEWVCVRSCSTATVKPSALAHRAVGMHQKPAAACLRSGGHVSPCKHFDLIIGSVFVLQRRNRRAAPWQRNEWDRYPQVRQRPARHRGGRKAILGRSEAREGAAAARAHALCYASSVPLILLVPN